MKKNLLFLPFIVAILGLTLSISGCMDSNKEELSHVKVHKYKQKSEVVNDNPDDDWIFWYIIMSDNGSCYYYSSPTPVTNYSSVTWTQSQTIPYAISDQNPKAEEVEELGEEEVDADELSEDMQSDLEADMDSEADSDSDSDSDSGDSGDSDSGDSGGDSGGDGGGDGGGGE